MSPTAPLEIVAGLAPLGDGPAGHRRFVHRAIELGYGRVWLPETFLTDPVSFAGWLAASAPGHPIGLGVLRGALNVDIGAFDLLGEVGAGRFTHHGAALVELLLQALGGLLPLVELRDLLLLERLHAGAGLLAFSRFGDDTLQHHESDLGALGERQDRRGGRGRRGRGLSGGGRGLRRRRRRGLGERSGSGHDHEAKGHNHTSHC